MDCSIRLCPSNPNISSRSINQLENKKGSKCIANHFIPVFYSKSNNEKTEEHTDYNITCVSKFLWSSSLIKEGQGKKNLFPGISHIRDGIVKQSSK